MFLFSSCPLPLLTTCPCPSAGGFLVFFAWTVRFLYIWISCLFIRPLAPEGPSPPPSAAVNQQQAPLNFWTEWKEVLLYISLSLICRGSRFRGTYLLDLLSLGVSYNELVIPTHTHTNTREGEKKNCRKGGWTETKKIGKEERDNREEKGVCCFGLVKISIFK